MSKGQSNLIECPTATGKYFEQEMNSDSIG